MKSQMTSLHAGTASVALLDKPIEETDRQDLNLDDNSIAEKTQITYPLRVDPDVLDDEVGRHPNTIVFLTRDSSQVFGD